MKRIKRTISILLSIAMLLVLLPTVAMAATPTDVGADFINNASAALTALGTDKAEWNSTTKTLILKGVNFTATATTAVMLPGGSTIVLADGTENTITGGSTASDYCYGIYAAGDLSIQGTGTLTVTSGDITAAAGTMPLESSGIYASGGLTISGGTVNATGGSITRGNSTAGLRSYGIYADSVTIQGGTVTAAGDEAGYGSTGIYANETVTISGSTVTATAESGPAVFESYGIWAGYYDNNDQFHAGTVTINSGTVILDTGAAGNTVLGGGTLTLAPVAPAVIERTGEAEPLVQKYADTPVVFSDVSRATVTVTGITANNKTYDGTKAAEVDIASASLTSVDPAHTVSLGTADVTATFDNANAGTDKAVTVSGTFDLRGNDAYKYSLTQPDLTGLTASIAPCTTVFDTTEHVQTIYKGTGTFDQPHIIGLFDDPDSDNQFVDTETGTITYMVSGTEIEAGVYDDVVNYLKTLDSGTEVTITYQFTGNANYEGATFADNGSDSATNTGRITIKVIDRPSSGGGSVSTYAISLSDTANGDITASHKCASRGTTVTVTVTPDEGYELNTLTATDASGNQLTLTGKDNGIYTFTMPASKVDLAATFTEIQKAPVNPFTDVKEGEYYYEAVLWAAENGITEGTSDTTFSPNAPCTRAQIVTFLWRAAGSPAPKSSSNPFVDVSADAYYYSAVLWAVENGITNGTGDGSTFSPDAVCSRSEAVTFLHRAKGSPAAATHNTFTDVPSGAWYASAVDWAVEQQITNGTGGNTFSPAADCTRAQIITFLYRAFAK